MIVKSLQNLLEPVAKRVENNKNRIKLYNLVVKPKYFSSFGIDLEIYWIKEAFIEVEHRAENCRFKKQNEKREQKSACEDNPPEIAQIASFSVLRVIINRGFQVAFVIFRHAQ